MALTTLQECMSTLLYSYRSSYFPVRKGNRVGAGPPGMALGFPLRKSYSTTFKYFLMILSNVLARFDGAASTAL